MGSVPPAGEGTVEEAVALGSLLAGDEHLRRLDHRRAQRLRRVVDMTLVGQVEPVVQVEEVEELGRVTGLDAQPVDGLGRVPRGAAAPVEGVGCDEAGTLDECSGRQPRRDVDAELVERR